MALLLASLAALGAVVLGAGIVRARRRLATTRRLAAMLALEEPLPAAAGPNQPVELPPPRWRVELRHVIARIEARDSALRGPAVTAACLSALVGLAMISAMWLGLAIALALAAYWLGRRDRRRRRIEAQALN